MPAVSVIVLVYKVEKYIERCARNLFGQTLQDMEFIFVDDDSPDRSIEVMERVLEDFPLRRGQVKVIRNEVNLGLPESRRMGVAAATGEYIIHCDSDDWPESEMYAKMYSKAREDNLDMVICQMRQVYPDHTEPAPDILGAEDALGALIRQEMYDHLFDKLVTRRAYEKGLTYPRLNMSEDTAILIQLAANCSTFGYVYETLYNYTVRGDSISHAENTQEKIDQMRDNYNLAFSCLEAKGLAKKHRYDIATLKCWLKSACQNLPRDYYMKLYPEVNLAFLFNRHFTVMQRLGHLTHILGIHGVSRKFTKDDR